MANRVALRHVAQFVPIWLALKLMCWLPLPLARGIAKLAVWILYLCTPQRRKIAYRNLELAMPETDLARRRTIVRGGYETIGRVILFHARVPRLTPANIGEWVSYEGFENYQKAFNRGRGVIYLTAHLGTWEIGSIAHALFGYPLNVMVRPIDNPLLDRIVNRNRQTGGNRILPKDSSVRDVLAAMKANQAVGMLADQNASAEEGVFVDFFGLKASASKGLALIAMRTGADVVPAFTFWKPERGRHVVRFYPSLQMVNSGDRDADVIENTQRCQAAVERAIREHPEQWLWIHRRWKRRPPGESPLYD